MNHRNWLYVIGPVTGLPGDNRRRFEEVRFELSRAGYPVVRIPHDLISAGMAWPEAMRISINEMTSGLYTGVATLGDLSRGSREELHIAELCGMETGTYLEWIERMN